MDKMRRELLKRDECKTSAARRNESGDRRGDHGHNNFWPHPAFHLITDQLPRAVASARRESSKARDLSLRQTEPPRRDVHANAAITAQKHCSLWTISPAVIFDIATVSRRCERDATWFRRGADAAQGHCEWRRFSISREALFKVARSHQPSAKD